jgi:hypothetical protein
MNAYITGTFLSMTLHEVSGQIHAPILYPRGTSLWDPVDTRLGMLQSRFGTEHASTHFTELLQLLWLPYEEAKRSSLSQNSKFRPIRTVKEFRNNSLSHEKVKSPVCISSLYKDTEEKSDNVHKAEGCRSHSHIYVYSGKGRTEANHGTGWVFNVLKQKRTFYTYALKVQFSKRVG